MIKPNGKIMVNQHRFMGCQQGNQLNKNMHLLTKNNEEVVARMPNVKVFSVLAIGFWQIELINNQTV